MQLSIVVPAYNEEENIEAFVCQIENVMRRTVGVSYEILFIDDGSTDCTLFNIKRLCLEHDGISYISFSRNFGKEAAIIAGLENTKGDYVAIMDSDLQDPPQMLMDMLRIIKSGEYDCVAARRITRRGEPPIRSFFAKMFYRIMNKISKTPVVDGARDFRMMTRQMVDAICSLPECNRFSKGLFQWVGFQTYWLDYENVERYAGKTKWSFWKLFIYSLDGFAAFSTVPLAISSIIGFMMSFGAFILGIYFIVQKLVGGIPIDGYASTIVVILMVGGVQLLCIGILGQYLAKTYVEVKRRPNYIIKEKNLVNAQDIREG